MTFIKLQNKGIITYVEATYHSCMWYVVTGRGILLAHIGPNAFYGATALVVGPLGPRPPYCGGL